MEFLPTEIDGKPVYAGFWRRLGAGIVDTLVLMPLMVATQAVTGLSIPATMICMVISNLLFCAYTIYFNYRFGATLGKMATGIRITLPSGERIGLRQVVLRSSVEMIFSWIMLGAHVVAISKVDPETYLNSAWKYRASIMMPLLPAWYGIVSNASQVWYWSEIIVLLFNKRKRAIHDYIAGTVIINRRYAQDGSTVETAVPAPVPAG